MTQNEVESLKLGITPIDDRTILIVESGIDWLKQNTTINCDDVTALPSCARLFLVRFAEINANNIMVQSEAIEGLNQSFKSDSINNLIWNCAEELLNPYLVSRCRFITATDRWTY